jgi:hypothetical protein
MRNVFFSLACLLLFFSCSTNNGVTTVVPVAPTNLTGTAISSTQINLSWTDNATNEFGYKVQRKTAGGSFTDVGSTGVDISTFSDLGLTPNTIYLYRVYAYNGAGNSLQYSNEVTINTNQILDKYYLDILITNGVNQNISTCRKQSYIIFNSNGTFSRRDWFDISPSNCVLDGIDDGQFVYNPQDSTLKLIFTDTEIWHNVQIIGNRIKFTWDENLDGLDEHYVEFLKR